VLEAKPGASLVLLVVVDVGTSRKDDNAPRKGITITMDPEVA
jgi:hypothetical protein